MPVESVGGCRSSGRVVGEAENGTGKGREGNEV